MGRSGVAMVVCAGLLLVVFQQEVAACPMCAESVGADASQPNLPQAYMWSILFMLGMPATVLGVLGGLVVKAVRAADSAHAFESEPLALKPSSREPGAGVDAITGETAIGVYPV
jgi:hypothetical protein